MVFRSTRSAELTRDRILNAAALTERAFQGSDMPFCMRVDQTPKKRRDPDDDTIYVDVRARLFKKEVTARKLEIAVAPARIGSELTVKFRAGLPIFLFPFSILLVPIPCALVCVPFILLMVFLQSSNLEIVKTIAGLLTLPAAILVIHWSVQAVPGYFAKKHIHAGNYAIGFFRENDCSVVQNKK